jgi:hypothetical protein
MGEGKSPSCHLVVLPNKSAFEENKLINLGMVVSVTVFLYFVNSLKCFLFTTEDMDFLLSLCRIIVISYKGYRVRVFKSIQSKYISLHQLSRLWVYIEFKLWKKTCLNVTYK